MSLLSRIADRLILCPSTQPIDPDGKKRHWIDTSFGKIEAWVSTCPVDASPQEIELTVLKFPGTAGRAERAGVHPVEIWATSAEVWTINPHGYGGSAGRASVKKFPRMVDAVASHLQQAHPNRRVFVIGNSLGCMSALYYARNFRAEGLVLRNPPPVRDMIRTRPRYSAWNLGMSSWIADQVPREMDAIDNAGHCEVNCLFIQSARDRVVPVPYQDKIFQAYRGSIEKFVIAGADHHEMVQERQQQEYFDALQRFYTNSN